MNTTHRKVVDAILILILILLPLLFFWRLITPNPADQMNIAAGDFTEQYFPLRAFAAQEWVRGNIPLWNPYLYGGQPALADIQSGALYPPHVVQSLLIGWGGPLFGADGGFPVKALEWQAIFHFSLAAVGTYLFGRYLILQAGYRRRQAQFGGLIASLVFTYGGYLTGFPVQQLTILEASAWLPWVLWGITGANLQICKSADDDPQRKCRAARFIRVLSIVAGTALAFAMAILAGHPQTVMYIFYLSLAYSVFIAFLRGYNAGPRQFSLRSAGVVLLHPVGVWLTTVALGVGLSAAQLLPTLEFIRHSVRADLSYAAVSAGLPLSELVSILYPGFFGGSPEYVGIASLVFIALALVTAVASLSMRSQVGESPLPAPPRSSAPPLFFWAGAGLISLLLSFGNNLFWYPLFYLFAPGFESVRRQERAFFIYSFSAALLAGFGAAMVVGALPRPIRKAFTQFEHRLRAIGGVAFFITGLFIYGSTAAAVRGDAVNLFYGVLWQHLFGLMILAGMLLFFGLRSRRRLRRWWGMGLLAVWVAFNLFTVNWQFNLADPADVPAFTANGVVSFLQDAVGPQASQPGRISGGGFLPGGNSAASVYNLQDLTGNTPLQLAGVNDFMQAMPSWRLWQLMNVRYIVDERDIGDAGLYPVFEEDGIKVFEMGDPFDRAWFVPAVEVIANEQQAAARLAEDDFDLRGAAVVAKPLRVALSPTEGSFVTVQKISPTHLELITQAAGNQLLVISQIYYPGWQVTVDGQPGEVLQVNAVLQGVVITSGQHTVELTYWPAMFNLGAVISTLALIVTGALAVLPALISHRNKELFAPV